MKILYPFCFVFFILILPQVNCYYRNTLPPAPYITDLRGDSCDNDETCLSRYDNSYCKASEQGDPACHCSKGFVSSSNRTRCLASDVQLGGSCEENQQCSSWETSTAVCLTGSEVCDCIPGFIPSDDLTYCLPIVNVLGTVSCTEDAQCQLGKPGVLSKCAKRSQSTSDDFRVCKCAENAVNAAKDNRCYPIANFQGDECSVHAQCTKGLKNSRCVDKQCRCNQGYKPRPKNGKNFCTKA